MKALLIGGGVMGEALLAAALRRNIFGREDITVCDVLEHRRNQLRGEYGVATAAEAEPLIPEADVIILAVKPQDLGSVRGKLREAALLISIVAGVSIRRLATHFEHRRIVRVMPNTPAAAGVGMSVWTATEDVTPDQRQLVANLLSALGRELFVPDERKVDMATAVSGSGPAYVYLFAEALIEGAVSIGLSRRDAEELVLQTILGSARYAQESGRSPAELRAMVTSPAGTTAAGLLAMERGAIRAAIIEGVRAAYQRALELGEEA